MEDLQTELSLQSFAVEDKEATGKEQYQSTTWYSSSNGDLSRDLPCDELWNTYSEDGANKPSSPFLMPVESNEPKDLLIHNFLNVKNLSALNSEEWSTADNTSVDDPYLEIKLATQRNTFTYGEIEEFDISTPPSSRTAISCPSRYYNCESSLESQGSDVAVKPKGHKGISRKLKKAKGYMKGIILKPFDAAVKFTRYCKKRLK